MALPAADNFNRADENPLGGNWVNDTGYGACRIVSNAVDGAAGASCMARWNVDVPNADQYCQVRIAAGATIFYQGAAVRVQGNSSKTAYILFAYSATQITLYRFVGGVGTVLYNDGAVSVAPGDTIKLEASGTGAAVTLRAYINGVNYGGDILDTAADRIIAAGLLGIHTYANVGHTLDDFEGGNLAAGAQPSGGPADTVKAIEDNLSAVLTAQGFNVEDSSSNKELDSVPLCVIRHMGEDFGASHGERPSTTRFGTRSRSGSRTSTRQPAGTR